MKEIWKDIKGYESVYQISSKGRVKSFKRNSSHGQILKPNLDTRGYLKVALSVFGVYKSKRIHRLVATTFINNPNNKPEVNHKDGVKTNNESKNLEWVTRLENKRHASKNGLVAKGKMKKRLTIDDIVEVKKMIRDGISNEKIGKKFKVTSSLVSMIKNGHVRSSVKIP